VNTRLGSDKALIPRLGRFLVVNLDLFPSRLLERRCFSEAWSIKEHHVFELVPMRLGTLEGRILLSLNRPLLSAQNRESDRRSKLTRESHHPINPESCTLVETRLVLPHLQSAIQHYRFLPIFRHSRQWKNKLSHSLGLIRDPSWGRKCPEETADNSGSVLCIHALRRCMNTRTLLSSIGRVEG